MTMATETIFDQPESLVRDLTDDDFQARYACDRFTATVLASRFRYVVQHMCTGLLNNAFSVILRDWYDFAATIAGPPEQEYSMPAMSNSLVLFVGTMTDAVRSAVVEFGPENLSEGDILMVNDPYRIGTHVNDVCFIRPIFRDGKIVAFVNLQAHMLDMGGVVPGGFAGTKRDVFENGLVISPQLIYHEDKPVKSAWSLIFDNARFGACCCRTSRRSARTCGSASARWERRSTATAWTPCTAPCATRATCRPKPCDSRSRKGSRTACTSPRAWLTPTASPTTRRTSSTSRSPSRATASRST
jgi:hypothetical protein